MNIARARARLALEVLLHGAPEPPRWQPVDEDLLVKTSGEVLVAVPDVNPLEEDAAAARRRVAALRMMDEDCHGYLLLTIHREAFGPRGEIKLAGDIQDEWLPAISLTLRKMLAAAKERW